MSSRADIALLETQKIMNDLSPFYCGQYRLGIVLDLLDDLSFQLQCIKNGILDEDTEWEDE